MVDALTAAIAAMRDAGRDVPPVLEELLMLLAAQVDAQTPSAKK